ncbi:MAG: Unknown protein [uncultured Sulfurovum sp.]|uniref:Response regulatory domain-containing protein n=1 Tax=uncultured Sulfurovum sp. TaxID=269237 RepID=A0A6S6U0Y9_9BACT|nr:MAG: Unknown protein [uncultured Sulfurovum sp.]
MYVDGKILIVEDEKISAEYLKEVLEFNGFNVVAICDKGAEAIKVAQALKPDVIFMDIMLKDHVSGSEAAVEIAQRIDTKIIFLTSYSNEEMIEYALDAGAFNYLLKPFREKQIITTLQMALGRSDKSQGISKELIYLSQDYSYSYKYKKLYFNHNEVSLGDKSLKAISYLCQHANVTVSAKELSLYVYGEQRDTSALRTLISRIKKKLGDDFIRHSGLGYMIKTDDLKTL